VELFLHNARADRAVTLPLPNGVQRTILPGDAAALPGDAQWALVLAVAPHTGELVVVDPTARVPDRRQDWAAQHDMPTLVDAALTR